MAIAYRLALLALMVPGSLMAGFVVPSLCDSGVDCNYAITGTGLDVSVNPPTEDVTTAWTLVFSYAGPLTFNSNAAPLSFDVTGSPADGWDYDPLNSGLTTYLNTYAAAYVTFDDTNSDSLGIASVTYTFYGSDDFWATLGSQAFDNPPDTTSGAFSTFPSFDPPCSSCSVDLTATPEPGSLTLLLLPAGLLGLRLRRRCTR